MTVFLTTLGLIGAAEMGDKTQLLTLALAARLPLGAVLGGVVVATLLNHALAVVVGGAALLVVPASVLRAAAGLSFIGFGLWTLRGDQLAGNEERRVGPPLVTVAVSFFSPRWVTRRSSQRPCWQRRRRASCPCGWGPYSG